MGYDFCDSLTLSLLLKIVPLPPPHSAVGSAKDIHDPPQIMLKSLGKQLISGRV